MKISLPFCLLVFVSGLIEASPVMKIDFAYPTNIELESIRYDYRYISPGNFNQMWTPIHESISMSFAKFKSLKTHGDEITLTLEKIEIHEGIVLIFIQEEGSVEWGDVDVFSTCVSLGIGLTLSRSNPHGVNIPDIKGFRFVGGRFKNWPKKGYYEVKPFKTVKK